MYVQYLTYMYPVVNSSPKVSDVYVCCFQICPYVTVVLVSILEYAFSLSYIYSVADVAS